MHATCSFFIYPRILESHQQEGFGNILETAPARIKDDLHSRTPLVSILSLQRIARNGRAVVGAAVFLEEPASFLMHGSLELILFHDIDDLG
jgi:hypothetical protein